MFKAQKDLYDLGYSALEAEPEAMDSGPDLGVSLAMIGMGVLFGTTVAIMAVRSARYTNQESEAVSNRECSD